ncbi:MAG: DUF2190 family protein [Thermoguttaceae bacterium]|nr:DUF2190 family protein [Thermoguttaceae bacterium]MBR2002694.1 DUF2190 family protein [Thermoguttaceae bacterium]
MTAIFKRRGDMWTIVPTVDIPAGTVVAVGALVGVAPTPIAANEPGDLNAFGEYDVSITPGAAIAVGDLVTTAAVTPDGTPTAVEFGPALVAANSTATTVRARLRTDRDAA